MIKQNFESVKIFFKQNFKVQIFGIAFAIAFAVALTAFLVVVFLERSNEIGDSAAAVPPVEFEVPESPPPVILPVEEDDPEEDEEEHEEPDLRPRSILTGLPVDEEILYRRPIAVVVNNIRDALPQCGIASADVIYEVLAEGSVTRFVAIFQSRIPDKIGPIRSARDYFIDFAHNHDAVFVHHGGSDGAYARIRSLGTNAVDGMRLDGTVFWRDRTYPYWALNTGVRPLEHSSYTGWGRLYPHIEGLGFRNYLNPDPAFGFLFGEIPEDVVSLGAAERVVVPFAANSHRIFVFDGESGNYMVENRDGAHMDGITREQVAVANVLIQLTAMRVVDAEGRRNVTTVGEGRGYLVTGGEYFAVTWIKSGHASPTRWYFENGAPVVLAPGVTWICVFQNTGTVVFE